MKARGQSLGGPVLQKNRHVPERSCVACGAKMPKMQLVRVASSSEGTFTIDTTGRASGRGAYLCKSSECWEQAIVKGAIERSLRRELSAQDIGQIRTYYQENIAPNVTAT
ncbi:MAG: YlxR family protein [SAR202 cluster bacterium]|nr:YlxR family protein [SAR202 cluster bacterium]